MADNTPDTSETLSLDLLERLERLERRALRAQWLWARSSNSSIRQDERRHRRHSKAKVELDKARIAAAPALIAEIKRATREEKRLREENEELRRESLRLGFLERCMDLLWQTGRFRALYRDARMVRITPQETEGPDLIEALEPACYFRLRLAEEEKQGVEKTQ